MKGTLKKIDGKWLITYMDWTYKPTGGKTVLGAYRKQLKEFTVELDPSDSNDAESLCGTNYTLEGKEVRFAFKEVGGVRYGRLKNPTEITSLDGIEQEILNETFKKSVKKYPTIDSRISTHLGFKCMVCENQIELSELKQMCDLCLEALKSLILEKRANPKQ